MWHKRILAMVTMVLLISLTGTVLARTTSEIKVTETAEETFAEDIVVDKIVIEAEPVETEPEQTEFVYVEKFTEVPLYNQLDYGTTRYGDSTVKRSGCGIASYAMVLTYLLDREVLPDELAEMYHRYKVKAGSAHSLFIDTTEDWGVTVECCGWQGAWVDGKVMEALENGQPIIAAMSKDSVFTDGGHLIVLYGLTEDGKILVRDPNGANYMGVGFLAEGLVNGFDYNYFRSIAGTYFIYGAKDLDSIAEKAEQEMINSTTAEN